MKYMLPMYKPNHLGSILVHFPVNIYNPTKRYITVKTLQMSSLSLIYLRCKLLVIAKKMLYCHECVHMLTMYTLENI